MLTYFVTKNSLFYISLFGFLNSLFLSFLYLPFARVRISENLVKEYLDYGFFIFEIKSFDVKNYSGYYRSNFTLGEGYTICFHGEEKFNTSIYRGEEEIIQIIASHHNKSAD